MRLLHSSRRELTYFVADDDIPPYAILSHTWGKEEVSLQDWQVLSPHEIEIRQGYAKIKSSCEQAQRDGLQWVWIDTCCIDKTSSAELSEAINSMFRWYQNAVVCYAFLSDVPSSTTLPDLQANLARSRWFTRGWTLQELIAPSNLVFYSTAWHRLGTKSQLHSTLSSITGIEKQYLNSDNLELASTAKKMSWAALRKTSRVEDIAYSLLGILDINMPLIYGEGKKAFRRLQEEVLKVRPDDHSLFAWGAIVSSASIKISDLRLYAAQEPAERSQNDIRHPLRGLFAESPRDFFSSGGIIPMPSVSAFYRSARDVASFPQAIDGGVRVDIPVIDAFDSKYLWDKPKIEQIRTAKFVALLCCREMDRNHFIKIPVQRWGRGYFGRSNEVMLEDVKLYRNPLFSKRQTITVAPERRVELGVGDIILRRHLYPELHHCQNSVGDSFDVPNDNAVIEARKLRARPSFGYGYDIGDPSHEGNFTIQFSRQSDAAEPGDPLVVEIWMQDEEYDGSHSHTMSSPLDTWNLDAYPFPPISVRAERMEFDTDGSFVDVLDIVIWPTKTSDGRFRTLEPWSR